MIDNALKNKIPSEKEIEYLKVRTSKLNAKFNEILNDLLKELNNKKKSEQLNNDNEEIDERTRELSD